MAKQRWKGNTIYISQRLREELRPIDHCALTTVVAPMGYGKTTAVSWYLAERIRQQQAAVLRVSVYSDSLPILIIWVLSSDFLLCLGFWERLPE